MRRAQAILSIFVMAGVLASAPAAASGQEVTDHGTKQAGGLEITLVSAAPLSPEEMKRMMPGIGGTGGMQGTMRGMPGMGGGKGPPTHWIGVIVRDAKDDRAVSGLNITLTAQKEGLTRTVTLMPMPGSYGANISLPEKGRYKMTVTVARPGKPAELAFDFDYR